MVACGSAALGFNGSKLLTPLFRGMCGAASLLLIVILGLIIQNQRAPLPAYDSGCPSISWFKYFILIIPLAVAFIINPTQFSIGSLRSRGLILSSAQTKPKTEKVIEAENDLGLPPEIREISSDAEITLMDLFSAPDRPELMDRITSNEISLIVQVAYPQTLDKPADPNTFYGVRYMMVCCAADARPMGVLMKTEEPMKFPELTWIKVYGKVSYLNMNGTQLPEFTVSRLEKVSAPDNLYIY